MACFPGLGWDYFAEQFDLPRLRAINAYQGQHPPLHIIAAALAGIEPQRQGSLAHAAEYVPVATCSAQEFDALVAGFGLAG